MSQTCVILAAGRGSRLTNAESKPLAKVNKMALLENQLDSWRRAGVVQFVIVVGYRAKEIMNEINTLPIARQCNISWALNDEWEKPNGISVLKAEPFLDGPFYLTMADHIFHPDIIADFVKRPYAPNQLVLATDKPGEHNEHIDLDDVTKVQLDGDKILNISKQLKLYSAFDTGLFWCPPKLLDAIRMSQYQGDGSLSGGVRLFAQSENAVSVDIGERFWIDVDTPRDWEMAQELASTETVS